MQKLVQKHTLTLEAAKSLIGFAILKAQELGVGGAIAVVDDGGHLMCLERIDGTMVAAANIAIGKASTAIGFKRSGAVLEETVTTQRPAMQVLNSVAPAPFVPLKGSYPIEISGEIVGAIAVAGAGNGENDEIIASFALKQFMNFYDGSDQKNETAQPILQST
jgi:glc operon protein GlcG